MPKNTSSISRKYAVQIVAWTSMLLRRILLLSSGLHCVFFLEFGLKVGTSLSTVL
jgi:hypothetical protein